MENKYQIASLLDKSKYIEDAVYAVQYVTGKKLIYAVGGSKCGSSSCASQSKCGNSRASSVSSSNLEKKVE
ncbi:MAG: hypothetical protein QXH60_00220 [Candidatus Pacearchaeota archaeon]